MKTENITVNGLSSTYATCSIKSKVNQQNLLVTCFKACPQLDHSHSKKKPWSGNLTKDLEISACAQFLSWHVYFQGPGLPMKSHLKNMHFYLPIREGSERKVSARDPIFGGSGVPKPLPLEDSNITGVSQAARKIKSTKIGRQ